MARPSMIKKAQASPYGLALLADPCAWCGQRCCTTLDHVEPVARDGSDDWQNLVGVCTQCNHARGRALRDAQALAGLWAGVGR